MKNKIASIGSSQSHADRNLNYDNQKAIGFGAEGYNSGWSFVIPDLLYVFTEHGAVEAANVLNRRVVIDASIMLVRAI